MALVSLGPGFLYPMYPNVLPPYSGAGGVSLPGTPATVMDAVGEMVAYIGYVWFPEGPGTSKTLSSAGGKIEFLTGTTGHVWASAGTTLRVGIQDVSTTTGPPAQPDEVWTGEPQVDLVQGVDALAATTWKVATLTSGSRTLTHGDLIAVVFDMTVRNGVDAATVNGWSTSGILHRPITSMKLGAGWVATAVVIPNVVIVCDDGTLCSLENTYPVTAATARSINTGTTPDEIGNIIVAPFDCKVSSLWTNINNATGEFELSLYSDPLGTPISERSVTIDLNQMQSVSGRPIHLNIPEFTMSAGVAYAVTLRPTTATTCGTYDVTYNHANHAKFHPGGLSTYKCTRVNDTGAFGTDTLSKVFVGVTVSHIDDGTGLATDVAQIDVRDGTAYTGTAGDSRTGSLDVPAAASVLNGVAVDATTGTYVPVATTNVKTGITYGAASALTGTCAVPGAADVRSGVAVNATTGTAAIPAAGDVEFGVAVDATTGTFVVPTEAQVELAVDFGNAAEFTGTLAPGGATAAEIATEVLDTQIVEAGMSTRQALKLMLAALAGKVSGGGTTTITIRNTADSKNRIIATVDANGNRSALTYDVT